MADVMRERQAVKCRARIGVVNRRLFAEKIGRDDEPVAAGGTRLGETVEPLMDREASLVRRLFFTACELAHEPIERRAARRHASVGNEQAGLQMVVEKQARIGARPVGRCQNVDRAAEFEQHVAIADDSRAERGGDVVRGAADDRRSGFQSALRRALIRNGAQDFVRGDLAGQRAARDMRKRDQRIVDRVRREVDETGLKRPVLLDRALAGEAPVDVVVGAEHGGDAREDFGLLALDPSKLRCDKLLIDSVAGLGDENASRRSRREAPRLRRRSAHRSAGCWASAGARRNRAAPPPAACRSRRQRQFRRQKRRSRCRSSRTISPTLVHHCSGSSSAQPTWSERSATGREARAIVLSGGRMRIPMVEVVPMSRPRTAGHGSRLASFVISANAGIRTRR